MIEVIINGETRQIAANQTLHALIDTLGHTGRRIAIERNGEIVPKSLHDTTLLTPGDRLEIVVAVGGG